MKGTTLALAGILTAALLSGCNNGTTRPDTESSTAVNTSESAPATTAGGTIHVQQYTPYAKNGMNDSAVMRECIIDEQLPKFISSSASEHGMNVVIEPVVKEDNKGRNLVVKFVKTRSSGNAFIGHYKYTEVKAVLYENGKEIADLTAGRRSGGGLFAGFKGSCSVMGRTVEALGNDIALWLKAPAPGMRRGDI